MCWSPICAMVQASILSEGFLERETVTCPWHVTDFDIKAGEPLEGPSEDRTRRSRMRVEGGEIRLKTSE